MLLNINEMFYYSWPSLTYDAADAACKQIAKDLQNKKILMVVVFFFLFFWEQVSAASSVYLSFVSDYFYTAEDA